MAYTRLRSQEIHNLRHCCHRTPIPADTRCLYRNPHTPPHRALIQYSSYRDHWATVSRIDDFDVDHFMVMVSIMSQLTGWLMVTDLDEEEK